MIRAAAARGALAAVLAVAAAAAAEPSRPLELEGAWHLLIHFRDTGSPRPDRVLWEDRLWVFEREGDRLVWRDYPIVVFENDAGRFERSRATGDRFRAEVPWSPDPGQEAEIRSGLRVNPRGARRKRLAPAPEADGWASPGRALPGSASSVTYSERARVTGLSDLPVFEWTAVLDSARAESLEGVTRFETREVRDGGRLLVGRYRRDDHLEGTFWLRRAGPPAEARGAARAREARFQARFYGQLADALLSDPRLEAALDDRSGPVPDPDSRERVAALIRDVLEAELDARGGSSVPLPRPARGHCSRARRPAARGAAAPRRGGPAAPGRRGRPVSGAPRQPTLPVRVRPGTPADLLEIVRHWSEITRHHEPIDPLFRQREDAEPWIRDLVGQMLRDPDTAVFVAELEGDEAVAAGGGLAGICVVRIDRAPPILEETVRAEITDVGVRPELRRRGIGRALAEAALDWVRERGVGRVEVRVAAGNPEGQAFWRGLGFGELFHVLHRRLP